MMCRLDGGAVSSEDLAPLAAPLRARGPDATDVWRSHSVGVASTLLDSGDARLRPRVTRVTRHLIAGQVRLDGRAELVSRLLGAGSPASDGDADVVLFARAWEAWGPRALAHLLGDFSAVIVDEATGECTLVRDPFGVRMLFYSATRECIVASNTLAAVLAAPGVSRALDDDALADFIAVGLNENLAGTTYRDVRRVPPGHCLRLVPGRAAEVSRYWNLPEVEPAPARADHAERFLAALGESVADRCRADSVTVLMSGGLDSTSLAALARRAMPASSRITALTLDFPTMAPSPEAGHARLAATHCGLAHADFNGDAFGYGEGLDGAQYHTPEPYDEPDMAMWRALLTTASASSRVLLYGEDPDALLAPPDLHEQLRARPAWRVGWQILSFVVRERSRPHLGLRDSLRRAREQRRGIAVDDAGPVWLRKDLLERRAERLSCRAPATHPTRAEVARRLAYPLWQTLLESLDAGQHGIPVDIRLPYLDRRVVESALAAPAIPWLQRKRLLREAMRGILPDVVRLAPKRGLDGLYEARVARWWSRGPRPFEPSERLRELVRVGALPHVTPASAPLDVLAHLRLRILDRWLRTEARES